MDAATKVQLTGLLYTLVLPLGAAALTLLAGHRLRPEAGRITTAVALIAGLAVAVLGIGGRPSSPLGAGDWLLIGPAVGGIAALALDAFEDRLGRLLLPIAGLLGAVLLAYFGWQIVGALAGLWTDGHIRPLAGSAWVVDGLATGLVVWIVLHHAIAGPARVEPADPARGEGVPRAPLVLGPLALALVGGAVATVLTGSARVGQQLGAMAAVVGLVGLAGWRWPALRPGHGAVGAATLALVLGLIYAHFFVELPRPIAGLLLLSPYGAVAALGAARLLGRPLPAVGLGLALSGAVVGGAVGLTVAHESAKAAAADADSGADGEDDGAYYPY